jgi:2-polyprenyl-6-methoxyphenol hydroxylase-like FAD-dependent oxidoreductase
MRQTRTEVLVVGAGPVGLWTALLLAESGIEVVLIDRETHTTARSYACALHPATLAMFDQFGLAQSVIARGRRIETAGFYDGAQRQAEVHLSNIRGEFPFMLILPQSALEGLLEQRLRAAGVQVLWNHRFEGLTQDENSISAVVEELEGTSTGYIVPHWETVVKARGDLEAQFVIGTDGQNSMVRSRAPLEYKRVGPAESFAAIEFQMEESAPQELRIVLDDTTTNVLWPIGDHHCRWTFQLLRPNSLGDFPEKERRSVRVSDPSVDERIGQYVQKLATQRAPWFTGSLSKIDWCTEVTFEKRLVTPFGTNRCWLAGDAAHQTGPVGVQSMNAGFAEALILANSLKKILREGASTNLLEGYGANAQQQWQLLLGLTGGLKASAKTNPWIAKRADRLLPCLPGHGESMKGLAGQLGLELAGG